MKLLGEAGIPAGAVPDTDELNKDVTTARSDRRDVDAPRRSPRALGPLARPPEAHEARGAGGSRVPRAVEAVAALKADGAL